MSLHVLLTPSLLHLYFIILLASYHPLNLSAWTSDGIKKDQPGGHGRDLNMDEILGSLLSLKGMESQELALKLRAARFLSSY